LPISMQTCSRWSTEVNFLGSSMLHKIILHHAALSATCSATRQRQMRDVRQDRDATGGDEDQRKDYYYLFYDRAAS